MIYNTGVVVGMAVAWQSAWSEEFDIAVVTRVYFKDY